MVKIVPILTVGAGIALAQPGVPFRPTGAESPSRSEVQQQPTPTVNQSQNPFQGSVPSGEKVGGTFALTLQDAIQRGLKQNLGLILGDQNTRLATAQQARSKSALLPTVSARVTDTVEKINLKAFGFNITVPNFNFPSIVGPFNVFDARASVSQSVLNFTSLNNLRASRENTRAAQLSYRDSRDVVVQVVASGYLQVIADAARVEEARTEVTTAQALYQRATDLLNNGLSPAIDALRAQVELQSEQTRLRSYENDFAKDKLALGRLIGLPLEQEFTLGTDVPYTALPDVSVEDTLSQAYKTRSDYQAIEAQVRAAELLKRAAHSERLPSAEFNADYGDIGTHPISARPTFTISGALSVTIFDGGRIRADEEEADVEIQQRKAQLSDLKGAIEYQVRAALLDLRTAADQVAVASSSLNLARQTLTQAEDRFAAGVTDNIEVVQAQNSVASASEAYINSVYSHNVAKVQLARAIGTSDQRVQEYLGGR